MEIFQIEEGEAPKKLQPKITKQELAWVILGVRFKQAKALNKNLTSRQFANDNDINYGTFTKSMFRYKSKIDLAYEAEVAKSKPTNRLTKREKEAILINSFRQSLRGKIATASGKKTDKWFNETLKAGVRGHKVVRPEAGKIYAFIYDAKHKETLPYWDKYPLIIFLGTVHSKVSKTTMFQGLNLHYVPPKARQQFLEDLLKSHASTSVISNNTKLKIDWSKVKGFNGADKMIKNYLPSHVKGRFVEIKPADWANVVLMPLQQFQSKGSNFSASKVWKR